MNPTLAINIITTTLSMIETYLPSITTSTAIQKVIDLIVQLLPVIIAEYQQLVPLIQNIIAVLQQNTEITDDQIDQLKAASAVIDAHFDQTAAAARLADAQAKLPVPAAT